ncbi:MAG: MBL fold metallo-hydrolase [Verrucomicrobiota bacterium]
MRIPLEDNCDDIIGKACRGLRVRPPTGPYDEVGLRQLAVTLGLGADALMASYRQTWYPHDTDAINGFAMFTTPFGDMTVNSYVVFDPITREAAAFDTGMDCAAMLAFGVNIRQIFLTHIHGDHVGDIDRLKQHTGARAFVSAREPLAGAELFSDDREFQVGSLCVQSRRTSGHTRGGTSYVVTGLARRLVFTGDALFAGSMGGALVDYQEALQTNRDNIFSLPAATVICPGHGPLTTVGEEQRRNPFFSP